jgi:hypothetical protein
MTSVYEKYFGQNVIDDYKLDHPCKRSELITKLRNIGDNKNQYVTNLYYMDTLRSHKGDIFSIYNDSDPVYNNKEHRQKVKENLVVGFRVYPKYVIPEKTYKQRKKEWEIYIK